MKGKLTQLMGFLAGSLFFIFLDQWTKGLAVRYLKDQPGKVIVKDVFELLYSENRGAAFSILQGRQGFLFIITLVVLALVFYALAKMPVKKRYLPLMLCLTLLFSGAVGNMIDRVSQGFVVDFLYFSLIDFPIFNVADIYVTGAAAFFLVLMLWYYKDEELAVFSLSSKKTNSSGKESGN